MRFVVVAACLALSSHPVSAQKSGPSSPVRNPSAQLAGTWRLVATRQRMTDGTIRPDPDLGANPSGYLMFDAVAKEMCTVINHGDRAKWADAAHPTDAEARSIWTQTVSYCATWSVDSTGRELVYRLGANMSPNLIGAERRRRFTLDGDRLVLYPTSLPPGVTEWSVEWRRASAIGVATLCVGLGAHDVQEVGKLLRGAGRIPLDSRPQLLADSPRCRQIAVAAGYRGRPVSVVQMHSFYAVLFGDELRVLDSQLQLVPQQPTKAE